MTKKPVVQESTELERALSRIKDLEQKSVVAIGTDSAFALTDQDGQIKAFKLMLELSVNEGTLVQIGNYPAAPVTISAQGYEKWAEKTGASVIFPKDVLVGDTLKPNPYMERDPDNKRVLAVHCRAVAFKYSPMGLPQVCDWSTIFDVPSYRMIDLLAKAKKTPQAFKLLPEGIEPKSDNNETWAKYPFDEATNLWLNTSHNEVLDWFSSIINREKKAMDFAQTFARRNALKHLSGLQKPPDKVHQWSFPVLSWRPTGNNIVKWDASQYEQLQKRVAGMIEGNDEFEAGETKQIEIKKGVETISNELDNPEINEDVNPDDPIEMETQPEPDPEPPKDLSKEVRQAQALSRQFPAEFKQACHNIAYTDHIENLSDAIAINICKLVGQILDSENN
jgi:hypothetical protein